MPGKLVTSLYCIYYLTYFCFRSLKTGGAEIAREKWDEDDVNRNPDDSMDVVSSKTARNVLPDWTRTPLPLGPPISPSKVLL